MIVIEFVFKLCQAPTVFIGYGFDTAESDSSKYIRNPRHGIRFHVNVYTTLPDQLSAILDISFTWRTDH